MDVLDLPDADRWEAWLAAEHDVRAEVWLRIAKRHSGIPSVTAAEALDVALCYGWIDGQRRAYDDVSFLQRFSPRRRRSSWSRVNVGKVEALLAAGRMRPPGLAEVEAAQADGRWEAAYESQRTAAVPPDLAAALAGNARAQRGLRAPRPIRSVRGDPAVAQGTHAGGAAKILAGAVARGWRLRARCCSS